MEATFSLIDRVLPALLDTDRQIHDDTQLEKLAGLFDSLISDTDTLKTLLSDGITPSYLSTLVGEPDRAPDRLILGLRIASSLALVCTDGILIPMKDKEYSLDHFCDSLLESLWKTAQKPDYWQDGGVRKAWLDGLLKFMHRNSRKGLKQIIEIGYLEVVLSLFHSETSMFVRQSVEEILAMTLTLGQQHQDASDKNGDSGGSLALILDTIYPGLTNPAFTTLISSLKILGILATGSSTGHSAMDAHTGHSHGETFDDAGFPKDVWMSILEMKPLVDLLCRILVDARPSLPTHQRKALFSHVSTILTPLMNHKLLSTSQQQDLCTLPHTLVMKGDFDLSMRIAAWLSYWFEECRGNPMSNYVMLPQLYHLNKAQESFSPEDWRQLEPMLMKKSVSLLPISITLLSKLSESRAQEAQHLSILSSLLAQTVEQSPGHTMGSIVDNQRLQLSICDSIGQLLKKASISSTRTTTKLPLEPELRHSLSTLCLKILGQHQVGSVLTQALYQVILLCVAYDRAPTSSRLETCHLDLLGDVLQRHLCAVQWEVRDTALEMMGQMIEKSEELVMELCTIKQRSLVRDVWQSVGDGESYVRAAALKCLLCASRAPSLWAEFTSATPQAEVVQKVIDVTVDDTEAFARRAALEVLCAWCQDVTFQSTWDALQLAINNCISDMDWEVKLQVLTFWQKRIDGIDTKPKSDLPAYAVTLNQDATNKSESTVIEKLDALGQCGCYYTVIKGLNDYDRSVQHRGCCILRDLKRCYGHLDISDVSEMNAAEKLKDTHHSSGLANHIPQSVSKDSVSTLYGCLSYLRLLDLEKLEVTLSSSTDEYTKNPCMLLEDILISLDHKDDEYAIDCY